jgi:hypothetical protein
MRVDSAYSDLVAPRPRNHLQFTSPRTDYVHYSVHCIPVWDGEEMTNWSLKQLGTPAFNARLRAQLPPKVTTLYAPTVADMSGVIVESKRFTRAFPLDDRVTLWRPPLEKNSKTNLLSCDGTQFLENEGFCMSAGGCPLIVLSGLTTKGEYLCLMAHAGEDSLLDKEVVGGVDSFPSRTTFSVVDAMVNYAVQRGADVEDLTLRSFFSLPWETFAHPFDDRRKGKYYRKMSDFFDKNRFYESAIRYKDGIMCVCLSSLIKRQAEYRGIGRIDTGLCTLPIDGNYAYTRHKNPSCAGKVRNLVLGFHEPFRLQ